MGLLYEFTTLFCFLLLVNTVCASEYFRKFYQFYGLQELSNECSSGVINCIRRKEYTEIEAVHGTCAAATATKSCVMKTCDSKNLKDYLDLSCSPMKPGPGYTFSFKETSMAILYSGFSLECRKDLARGFGEKNPKDDVSWEAIKHLSFESLCESLRKNYDSLVGFQKGCTHDEISRLLHTTCEDEFENSYFRTKVTSPSCSIETINTCTKSVSSNKNNPMVWTKKDYCSALNKKTTCLDCTSQEFESAKKLACDATNQAELDYFTRFAQTQFQVESSSASCKQAFLTCFKVDNWHEYVLPATRQEFCTELKEKTTCLISNQCRHDTDLDALTYLNCDDYFQRYYFRLGFFFTEGYKCLNAGCVASLEITLTPELYDQKGYCRYLTDLRKCLLDAGTERCDYTRAAGLACGAPLTSQEVLQIETEVSIAQIITRLLQHSPQCSSHIMQTFPNLNEVTCEALQEKWTILLSNENCLAEYFNEVIGLLCGKTVERIWQNTVIAGANIPETCLAKLQECKQVSEEIIFFELADYCKLLSDKEACMKENNACTDKDFQDFQLVACNAKITPAQRYEIDKRVSISFIFSQISSHCQASFLGCYSISNIESFNVLSSSELLCTEYKKIKDCLVDGTENNKGKCEEYEAGMFDSYFCQDFPARQAYILQITNLNRLASEKCQINECFKPDLGYEFQRTVYDSYQYCTHVYSAIPCRNDNNYCTDRDIEEITKVACPEFTEEQITSIKTELEMRAIYTKPSTSDECRIKLSSCFNVTTDDWTDYDFKKGRKKICSDIKERKSCMTETNECSKFFANNLDQAACDDYTARTDIFNNLDEQVSVKCRHRLTACDSSQPSIASGPTDIKSARCTFLKDHEECAQQTKDSNMCTDKEYELILDKFDCFGCRIASLSGLYILSIAFISIMMF